MMKQTEAMLILADGTVFHGHALGAVGHVVGEVCFNTSMTGYQEILSDPSYTDQIMTFTQPHIGNVGTNDDDMESSGIAVRGCVVRAPARIASNYRASEDFNAWLKRQQVVGIAGVDTRALVIHLRTHGAQHGVIASDGMSQADALTMARDCPSLEGRDLVAQVSCSKVHTWDHGGSFDLDAAQWRVPACDQGHIVAFDFGCKNNIFRALADRGFRLSIVPANTSAADVLAMKPDGIFLSNGPGDPSAVDYAVDTIKTLIGINSTTLKKPTTKVPIFGICMGHQLLSQALGLTTFKLKFGHRGGNHPVRNEHDKRVEITSQNHGFAVSDAIIPETIEITHRSLFDGTIEGLKVKGQAIFSVQYHPEASPGPHDSDYLFDRFAGLVKKNT
ncbi:MAG: glutamine-hydrolyzing carbamoyl-phosphate synthase small subunit [Mariprofundaceae bacterium]|nr:glutamine-hydrolyzing carbamoyl-phosphate synthase small subunit [Mariprofundaceae bacterium]